jgi:hypothetical protein
VLAFSRTVIESRVRSKQLWGKGDKGVSCSILLSTIAGTLPMEAEFENCKY